MKRPLETKIPQITWRLKLNSPIEKVYSFFDTNEGRSLFWAEKAIENDRLIHFEFINGIKYQSKILKNQPPHTFEIEYFNTIVSIELQPAKKDGTLLTLKNYKVQKKEYSDMKAGWVSVLLTLKMACDYGIDIRNHDMTESWDQGFVNN